MYRSIITSLFFLTLMNGCASNYEATADLHDLNQENIKNLELLMVLGSSQGPDRNKYEQMADADKQVFLNQKREEKAQELKNALLTISTAVKAKKLSEAAAIQKDGRIKQNKLAGLENEYYQETDPLNARGNNLAALYLKMIEAIRALHENGKDISAYLNLGPFERVVTDVKGSDKEKLKQIGDDLKGIQKRLNL